jgi:hypothetical protein
MKPVPTFPRRATVTLIDGATFTGSATQIVAAMRAAAPEQHEDVAAYRKAFAERALLWMKQPIRTNDDASFLLDLAEIGIAAIVVRGAR